jgi:hypothetical protein
MSSILYPCQTFASNPNNRRRRGNGDLPQAESAPTTWSRQVCVKDRRREPGEKWVTLRKPERPDSWHHPRNGGNSIRWVTIQRMVLKHPQRYSAGKPFLRDKLPDEGTEGLHLWQLHHNHVPWLVPEGNGSRGNKERTFRFLLIQRLPLARGRGCAGGLGLALRSRRPSEDIAFQRRHQHCHRLWDAELGRPGAAGGSNDKRTANEKPR